MEQQKIMDLAKLMELQQNTGILPPSLEKQLARDVAGENTEKTALDIILSRIYENLELLKALDQKDVPSGDDLVEGIEKIPNLGEQQEVYCVFIGPIIRTMCKL